MIQCFKYLKSYWLMLILAILFVFAGGMCDLKLPNLMADIVNKGIMNSDMPMIWRTGGWMLLVTAGSVVSAILASFLMSRVAAGFGKTLRRAVFRKVTFFTNDNFNKFGTASLITRATNDVTQLQQFTIMSRVMMMAPIYGIGGIIMAVNTAPSMSWVIAVIVGVTLVLMAVVLIFVVPQFTKMQKKLDKLSRVLREALTGIRVVRAFNRVDRETEKFDDANHDLTNTALRINRIMAILMPIMMMVMSGTSLLIIWVGAVQIRDGMISSTDIGSVMAFIQYAMQILMGVMFLAIVFVFLPRAAVSGGRIRDVLYTENDQSTDGTLTVDGSLRGTLEFSDVVFRFAGAEMPVLHNISFTAKKGETTAIIGGTGSGKTALIDLIPRFYDIESGGITLDGVSIYDLSVDDLRSRVGLVPQQALLFSGTVADNIRFGKDDATEEEVRHAADIAQATHFIGQMDDGFDSEIAQGGANVSGGQRQRLAIARALVRKPEVYIFDDSFSALDFKTDANLRAALKDETRDSTVIIVAQRVSTIMDADQILVLDEGKLVGVGRHKELYEQCPVYREIVLSQLSEEELA